MDLFRVSLSPDWGIVVEISWWVAALAAALLALALFSMRWVRSLGRRNFEINEAEIGIGNQKVTIRPNHEDLQIAYRLWTELATRKIGLLIDDKNDVIAEIYDSWYAFFGIARNLIKEIPVFKLKNNKSTHEIVRISVDVLNIGLRPHLTRWQAKYRRWWEYASSLDENSSCTPQELQQRYPDYKELMKDMKEVNKKLVAYAGTLQKMVHIADPRTSDNRSGGCLSPSPDSST